MSSPSTFLELPPEICNRIYELCLVSNQLIDLQKLNKTEITVWNPEAKSFECWSAECIRDYNVPDYEDAFAGFPTEQPRLMPALLGVCRKIYSEAKPILYGLNVFHATITPKAAYRGRRTSLRYHPNRCTWSRNVREEATEDFISARGTIAWNANIKLVRRLSVSLRGYSFEQFLAEDPSFTCPESSCTHDRVQGIPRGLKLHLMFVSARPREVLWREPLNRSGRRQDQPLFTLQSTLRSEVHTVKRWRSESQRDMRDCLSDLIGSAPRITEELIIDTISTAPLLTPKTLTALRCPTPAMLQKFPTYKAHEDIPSNFGLLENLSYTYRPRCKWWKLSPQQLQLHCTDFGCGSDGYGDGAGSDSESASDYVTSETDDQEHSLDGMTRGEQMFAGHPLRATLRLIRRRLRVARRELRNAA
ncbi:hypothetical protein LTS02_017886 [Friedmanniomyces endolithicus]|nr:hypothetical protein LTS02_017886 [Friedmanniomyces endolithicus]KAK1083121.1 hypothetical protein LTR33_003459 [Friedmanniomyces endolithicus]